MKYVERYLPLWSLEKKSLAPKMLDVTCLQLNPYYDTPLWPDSVSLAALQARMMLESGCCTERDMAEVVSRSRANAEAQLKGDVGADALLAEQYHVSPLRRHDCPPISDGTST